MVKKVIVHIVIGLLGSGKTSALLHVLYSSTRFEKIGVVVGEFADEGYDGPKLQAAGYPVMMISGVGRRDQIKSYLGALRQMASGAKYERIFLETSGATEATQLAEALTQDAELAEMIEFGRTVAVVSIADFDHYMEHFPDQFLSQIRYADVVILNKIDKLKPEARMAVHDKVRAINADADIEMTYMGQVNRMAVTNAVPDNKPSRLLTVGSQEVRPKEFESFVYRTDELCMDRVRFGHALLNLPGRIARFKGALRCYDRIHGINGVPGQLDWDKADGVEGSTRIAVIGLDLAESQDEICALLDAQINPDGVS